MKKLVIMLISFIIFQSVTGQNQQKSGSKYQVPGACYECPASKDGSGSLGQIYNNSACGLNYAQATVMTTTRYTADPGTGFPTTLNISGIPAGANIEFAYLWYFASTPGGSQTVTINGDNYTSTLIGSGPGKCWPGYTSTINYRADVTPTITGNGNYTINVALGADQVDGITLFIIYTDLSAAYQGSLIINDGCIAMASGTPTSQTMTGFTACDNSTSGSAFIITSDMQNNVSPPQHQATLNGNTSTFPNLFYNFDVVATSVTNGQNTSAFGATPQSDDCYDWGVMGLYFQTTTCVVCGAPCSITSVTTNVTGCDPLTNTYSVSGIITFEQPPTTGTLTITDNSGANQVFTAPFTSPIAYNLTGITADGATHTLTVTFSDAAGCTFTQTYTAPNSCICIVDAGSGGKVCGLTFNLNATTQPGDYNTFWSASPSAGVTFSPNNTSPTAIVTVPNTISYTFTWTVTSADNVTCDDQIVVTFTQIPTSTFTVSSPILCFGDNTTITYVGNATPVATYTWNFDGGTVTSGDPNNPAAGFTVNWATSGTHNITLQVEEDGCTSTITTESVYNPPQLVTSIDTTGPIGCAGGSGSVTVNASGGTPGYTYDWGGANPDSLLAGTYCVTITDANACSNIECFTITEPDPLTVTTNQINLNCNGVCEGYAELNVSGGTGPYVYVWSNAPLHNFPSQDTMCAGTYTVVAKDFFTCEIYAYFTITEPAELNANITSSTDISCNSLCDGTASVTASGGMGPYSYEWTSGETTSNAFSLCGGDNTVTVTDNNGCTITDMIMNFEPSAISITLEDATDIICNGDNDGEITITATGGTNPLSYSITGAPQGIGTFTNLFPGTYTVTVTDNNGCTLTSNPLTINEPSAISIDSTNVTHITCNGDTNGIITITASGGTSPLSYSIDVTPQGIGTFTGLSAGYYTVTITDNNGCTATVYETIIEPTELTITTSTSDNYICQGDSAYVTAIPNGGTGPYYFFWDYDSSSFSIPVHPDTITTYTAYVTDGNGCMSNISSVTVNVYPPLNIILSTYDDTICPGDPAEISAIVSGGDGPPYLITNITDDETVVSPPFAVYPDVPIDYVISVTDFCTTPIATDTIRIYVSPAPPANIDADIIQGCEPLTVQFNEPNPEEGQTYSWNFGDEEISNDKNPEHTFENAGTYYVTLTVTSKAGCVTECNLEPIKVYPNPDAKFIAEPLTVSIIKPVILFENLSINDSIVQWNFGDGDSLFVTTPGHTQHKYSISGNYTVRLIAESKNGCKDTTYQDVIVKDEFTFYAPTAFSPDKDGVNDIFIPVGIGIDPNNFLMLIYDRWGEKVFVTHDLYQGWDGKIKGKKLGENGVYSWIVIYKDLQKVEHQEAGSVILIR